MEDGTSERSDVYAGERAASLRAIFPARGRTTGPASARLAQPKAPAPGAGRLGSDTGPGPEDIAQARRSRRWMAAAIIGGLVVIAGAAIIAVRSAGTGGEAPGEPLAAPSASLAAAPVPVGTRTVYVTPSGAASRPATGSASNAAGRPAPARSKASPTAAAKVVKSSIPETSSTGYSACATASTATFAMTFTETYSWHHVFINTDASTATGYRVPEVSGGLGADYMVENDLLYRSTGTTWGWTQISGESPLLSRSGGTYRWRVSLDAIGDPDDPLKVVFNGSGTSPDLNTPVLTAGGC